jgi:hypothetical protein
MSKTEHPSEYGAATTEPFPTVPLLPGQLASLREQPATIGLLHQTARGTAMLVKAPLDEIRPLLLPVRIQLHCELHSHPLSPVLRTALRLPDRSSRLLLAHATTNVGDPQEHDQIEALKVQRSLFVLLYDDVELIHRLSKRLPLSTYDRETVGKLIAQAERGLAKIPAERRDYPKARAAILEQIRL